MQMKKTILIISLIVLSFLTACSNKDLNIGDSEKLVVSASFYPQYYLAKEIGKDKINLSSIVPNGVEPHDFELTIKQIKEIQSADVLILNGANMEHWKDKLLKSINTQDIKIIESSKYVDVIKTDGIEDPHIWLNPKNMAKIAYEIKEVFIKKDAKNADFYESNYKELSKKLMELDKNYETILKDKKRDAILVSHAAFSYLANEYGFKQIAVTGISPEEEPSPGAMAELIDMAKAENMKYIFLETLASPKTANIIAEEANLEVLILNPVEGLTEEEQKSGEDYISIMEQNLLNLKKALVD
ncbi:MAG: ABC transporter zinc-binding lipoprotein ZnuA [Sporanaerobacter sp.]|jgi:zinc transport system substrate-binding protein|uniref:metal ABC transporter substrate-binding protein n=1 Tax=Sporanaerobacter sp. TaxID=2010183 RepID=UPI003A0FF896